MSELQLQSFGLDRPESGDDVAVPFALENLDSRGRFVRLGEALDSILSRHRYPEPVARLLGEAVVLATLIAVAWVDRFGRRPLLLTGLVGMTVSLAAVGMSFAALENEPAGATSTGGSPWP